MPSKSRRAASIEVEVYRVNASGLAALDRLEDYRVRAPSRGTYDRSVHATTFGPAWLYLYNPGVAGRPAIRQGGWPAN